MDYIFCIVKNRDALKKYLEDNNIQCAIHYPKPFYESNAYKHINTNNCENINLFKNNLLTLPMYPELTEVEVLNICININNFYK